MPVDSIINDDYAFAAMGVTPAQALGDLDRLGELIVSRQPEQGAELELIHQRYLPFPLDTNL